MRWIAALIIIAIAFVITVFNFGSSLILTRNTLNVTMSEDISLARDIANDFVSNRIWLYKSNAQTAAERLMKIDSVAAMENVMSELLTEFADFMAFTVFNKREIVAEYGDSPTSINLLDHSKYINAAFDGRTVISTIRFNETTGKLVMYICTPMNQNRILSVTISGMIFSEILDEYILRDTRSIFMLDEYGTVIAQQPTAHFLQYAVNSRINLITDQDVFGSQFSANFFNDMLMNEKGMGNYFINNVEYQCAYAKVSASETGWYICLSVPVSENLLNKLKNRLLVLDIIFFAIGIVAAIVCSGQIVKPYYKVADQNRSLEELMGETRRLQSELEAALKEAQEANRAKSTFLATMSHEMRTPLNAIVGFSELLLNTGIISQQPVLGEIKENLGKIYNSGITLLGIVNDILDISKIESGRFDLHPIKYDTSSLLNDIISLNIIRIREKPIKFFITVDDCLPKQLFGDDLRIKQIFNNLLSNAFKYTDYGIVEWNVSFERNGDNVWLVSYVKDTGIGIKNADIPKLFKNYSQVNAQTNRKAESTGLGLSITKHLVEMMDGNITFQNEYGKGMTFFVRLRQQFVSEVTIGRETANNIMNVRFANKRRTQNSLLKRVDLSYANVLVVDDVQTNLDVARGMLIPYGLYIDCALNGQQAIDMIRKENPRYDIVFMDHMMHDMDGIETVRIIREEIGTSYACNVPIIALTANAIIGNEKMFLKHGFQAFISKPIDLMLLDSILRRWVGNKKIYEKSDQKEEYEKNSYSSKNEEAFLNGIAIEGIDIDKGLKLFSGDKEVFINVLHSYSVNTRPLLGIIKKYLESDNIADYGVTVHGIKGSSFAIGAIQAGKYAERLEYMAKMRKMDEVLVENEVFDKYMENLLDSIDGTLNIIKVKNRKPIASSPDPELLQELRSACMEFDMGKVDKIITLLESYEYIKGAQLIKWLHEQVDEMNLSEISDGNWSNF